MSERSDKELLNDIIGSASRIESYVRSMNYEDFLSDNKTQDAVVRNIEIIGEAVKNLSKNFKDENQGIDWKKIAGMRDKIIHFYFGVNLDVVWKTSVNNIPDLKNKIKEALNKLEQNLLLENKQQSGS
ncbi:MAG: HepT-like ribonuclease domain-containing protein [Candidatus Humimicrobiaceae bacterium]